MFRDDDWLDVVTPMDDTVTYITDLPKLEIDSVTARCLRGLLEILSIPSEFIYEMPKCGFVVSEVRFRRFLVARVRQLRPWNVHNLEGELGWGRRD